jgi:hypothetical protein
MSSAPAAPLLTLVDRLTAYALAHASRRTGQVAITGVKLDPESIQFELAVRGLTFLMDGPYTADAQVLSTDAIETRCDLTLTTGKTAGRIAGSLMGLLPDSWFNAILVRWFPGVRREGEAYVVSHRALARSLLRLGALS